MKKNISLIVTFLIVFGYLSVSAEGDVTKKIPSYIENLVFRNSKFTQPLTMTIPIEDEPGMADEIKRTYMEADQEYSECKRRGGAFSLCLERVIIWQNLSLEKFLGGYVHISESVLDFLIKHDYVRIEKVTIGKGEFSLLYYNDKIRPYIFTYPPKGSYREFNMLSEILLASRKLKSIDYINQYEGTLPGTGAKTQFYALTFFYVLEEKLPGLPHVDKVFHGKAKAVLDPDDGQWKLWGGDIELEDSGSSEYMKLIEQQHKESKIKPEEESHTELEKGQSTELQLKRLWSSSHTDENLIALTYTNVVQESDKIKANVTLANSTGTWVFAQQNFNPSSTAKISVSGSTNAYLLGPFYNKELGTIEFPKGSFLQLDAQSPIGIKGSIFDPTNLSLLGAVAIDLMMRGLFNKELPPNAFDNPIVIPTKIGLESIDPLFKTISSHCSGQLGVLGNAIGTKNAEDALKAIAGFALCTKDIKEKMQEWLTNHYSKDIAEKYVQWTSKNIVDILDAPTRATLIGLLTKYTFSSPPESWVRVEAVEKKIEEAKKIYEPKTDGKSGKIRLISGEVTAIDTNTKIITVKGVKSEINVKCADDTICRETIRNIKLGDKVVIRYVTYDDENIAKKITVK